MKVALPFLLRCLLCLTLFPHLALSQDNALLFDDVDDHITFTSGPAFDGAGDMTFEAWVYPTTVSGTQSIVSWNGGGGNIMDFYIRDGILEVYQDDGSNGSPQTGTTSINANEWTHIAFTQNAGSMNFYVNGAEESILGPTGPAPTITNFTLAESSGGTNYFGGLMDEVRVWDTDLTQTVLQNQMFTSLVGNELNLIAYYNFNHTTGTVLTDLSASNDDGTLVNFPATTDPNWQSSTALTEVFTVTTTADDFAGSLRQAIVDANASAADNVLIDFDISGLGPWTISLVTELPVINQSMTIDGTTQPAWDLSTENMVGIDLGGVTSGDGFQIQAANVDIQGMQIVDAVFGILINGEAFDNILIEDNLIQQYTTAINIINGDDITIQGNHLGVSGDGLLGELISASGIVSSGSDNLVIGGDRSVGDGNHIAGSAFSSYLINVTNSTTATVHGNIIGASLVGNDLTNSRGIRFNSVNGITVGSVDDNFRNFVAGIADASALNISNADGANVINNYFGVGIVDSHTIGNSVEAINFSNVINFSIDGNVLSGSSQEGLIVTGTSNTGSILNNLIGVRPDGSTAFANTGHGINLTGSANSAITIGGGGDENIIAYNNTGIRTDQTSFGTVEISENSIFCNTTAGIDISGTPVVAAPVITSITPTTISGTTTSEDNSNILIYEVDASCAGNQGQVFIIEGSDVVSGGNWVVVGTFDITSSFVAVVVDDVNNVDAEFGSSEFSAPAQIDPFIVITTDDSGEGSLRWAIDNAMAGSSQETISFNIQTAAPWVITTTTTITVDGNASGVIIDGLSQPGASLWGDMVQIDGPNTTNVSAMVLSEPNIEVYGLHFIEAGRWIQTDADADNFVIGSSSDGNLFQSSNQYGLYIQDATGGTISGNRIGTSKDGNSVTGTGTGHHAIFLENADNTVIGGDRVAGEGNVISGSGNASTEYAIQIFSSENVEILGNAIGTNWDGTIELGNQTGINITTVSHNCHVGGANSSSDGNIIAGSTGTGIVVQSAVNDLLIQNNLIGLNAAGDMAFGNGTGIDISALGTGGQILMNTISGNDGFSGGGQGIYLDQFSNDLLIQSNRIGTNSSGTTTGFGNRAAGIHIRSAGGADNLNQIQILGNIISGNGTGGAAHHGIYFQRNAQEPHDIVIQNNSIGVELDGTTALPNNVGGIGFATTVSSLTGVIIGGVGNENIIANNVADGIFFENAAQEIAGLDLDLNSYFCNGGLAINFENTTTVDAPIIASVTTFEISGTSGATAGTVEVFAIDETCADNQGAVHVETGTIMGDGTWSISTNAPYDHTATYSAYVNDASNGISEFGATAEFEAFITTWSTTDGEINIPVKSDEVYTYDISWTNLTNATQGDGSDTGVTGDYLITGLNNFDVYQVEITGIFSAIQFNNNATNRVKILTVEQWGDLLWTNFSNAFYGCSNLTIPASDAPTLVAVTDMSGAFQGASSFDESIQHWDVSNIEDFSNMFRNASVFNQPLDAWTVTSALDMSHMFRDADAFNQDLNSWVPSSVTTMFSMFSSADVFDGAIGNWDVSLVQNMRSMFFLASDFNQPLAGWGATTGMVQDMSLMFSNADSFDQPLDAWDVSSVQDMSSMFADADVFDQDLNGWITTSLQNLSNTFQDAVLFDGQIDQWDVDQVTTFAFMFDGASAFNQPLNNWTVTGALSFQNMFRDADAFDQDLDLWTPTMVTDMFGMFSNCLVFDGDITTWDVTSVDDMANMFFLAPAFNQPIGSWGTTTGGVMDMGGMFRQATAFNQDISSWDVISVTDMANMFDEATSFNQDISGWATSNVQLFSNMFRLATAFDQNLGSWNLTSATTLVAMLNNSGMSISNYDATLIGWEAQGPPTGLTLGATGLNFCTSAAAKSSLEGATYNWTITDAGVDCSEAFIVTNTNDSGEGSLRWTMDNANLVSGANTITFNILVSDPNHSAGVWTISPTTDLPDIIETATLDATSQPGVENFKIVLDGQGTLAEGFHFTAINAAGSSVLGFYITDFSRGIRAQYASTSGITIGSPTGRNTIVNCTTGIELLNVQNAVIQSNYIGTDELGSALVGNTNGIQFTASPNHTVGGSGANEGNVISNNTNGIRANASAGQQIIGNFIGTTPNGLAALGNTVSGILLSTGSGHTVTGNVISGNDTRGLYLSNSSNNIIQDNYIGVGSDGTTSVPNGIGIETQSGSTNVDNQIGGLGLNEPNIIANNTSWGISLRAVNDLGNDIIGNEIYCNGTLGIDLQNGSNNSMIPPVITALDASSASGTGISGDDIHLYRSNSGCVPGQGEEYLGTATVNGSGDWTIGSLTIDIENDGVTATSTNPTDGTSQFSAEFMASPGHALHFDGDGHVDLGDVTFLDGLSALTIEAWFNTEVSPFFTASNEHYSIVAKGQMSFAGSNAAGIYFRSTDGGGDLIARVGTGSGTQTASFTSTNITENQWYHVALTWTSSGNVNMYVNGELVSSSSSTLDGTINDISESLFFGNSDSGSENQFEGLLDEVRIWNVERTQSDILTNMSTPLLGSEANLLAYYRFDQGVADGDNTSPAVDIIPDRTPNGNDGSLVGFILNGTTSNWVDSGGLPDPDPYTVTNTADSGIGSLRWAMTNANADGENVSFDIVGGGPWIISPLTNLPALTDRITIDGSTQPGWSDTNLIVVQQAGTSTVGIEVTFDDCELYGLEITGFDGVGDAGIYYNSVSEGQIGGSGRGNVLHGNYYGIRLSGSSGIVMRGNKIGTDNTGLVASANNRGIDISGGSDHRIGGSAAGDGNVISGNTGMGINVLGGTDTYIFGNYIGVTAAGDALLSNGGVGISLNGADHIVGGSGAGEKNVVAGNSGANVSIVNASGVDILGNNIGVDVSGLDIGSTTLFGIEIGGGSDNTVGGIGASEENIIANHTNAGVWVSPIFAPTNNTQIVGNLISCNGTGIDLQPGANNDKAPPTMNEVTSTTAGGTGVDGDQIHLYRDNSGCTPTDGQAAEYLGTTTVAGGTWQISGLTIAVGTDVLTTTATNGTDGTSEFAGQDPYAVTNTTDAGVGSLRWAINNANSSASKETISFNIAESAPWVITLQTALPTINNPSDVGVVIDGSSQPGWTFGDANAMVILDGATNSIGTNGLTIQEPNVEIYGLVIDGFFRGIRYNNGSSNLIIGAPGSGNIIKGCVGSGIISAGQADNMVVQGNYIGLSIDGLSTDPNLGTGIHVDGDNALVGGNAQLGEGNVISGNGTSGLEYGISIEAGDNVQIFGNLIGTDKDGENDLGNLRGIRVRIGVTNTLIGGQGTGQSNVIAGTNSAFSLHLEYGTGTIVDSNIIGLNSAGTMTIQNQGNGIDVDNTAGSGIIIRNNTISASSLDGIYVNGHTSGLEISNNNIGTNLVGTIGVGGLGNLGHGIALDGSNGADNTTQRININANVISGNSGDGINFSSTCSNIVLTDNHIGVESNGTSPLGNSGSGIELSAVTTNIEIGGTSQENIIANNTQDGITFQSLSQTSAGTIIGVNSYFCNAEDAIDFTLTPTVDIPIITAVNASTVSGTSTASDGSTVDVYEISSTCADDQGAVYLGQTTITSGAWSYAGSFSASQVFTATVTDVTNGISEFAVATGLDGAGNALNFDGVDDYVDLGNVLDGVFSGPDNTFSVELWVNPQNLTAGDRKNLVAKYGNTNCAADERQFTISLWEDIGIVFTYYGTLAFNDFRQYSIGGPIPQNAWSHVAVTYDGSIDTGDGADRVTIYLNGVEQTLSPLGAAGSFPFDIPSGPAHVGVGAALNSSGTFCSAATNVFEGDMDELRIWNDVRTLAELQSNLHNPLVGNEAGLALYYDFDQGVPGGSNGGESTVFDRTASGNDGTLNNLALTGASSNWVLSEFTNPIAPSNLTTTEISDTQIDLSWQDNALNETGYSVERSDGNNTSFVPLATLASDATSFSDNTVTAGNGYFYRVIANGAIGNSNPSNEKFGTTITPPGSALDLDGSDDYVEINSLAAEMAGNESAMTIEFWTNASNIHTGTTWANFFGVHDVGGDNVFLIHIGAASVSIDNQIGITDGITGPEVTGPVIGDNTWHHVAYTRDGTLGTLYIDGSSVVTHTADFILSADDYWSLGVDIDPGITYNDFLDAELDEVRIWNTPRTEIEIQTDMFSTLQGNESGLVAYYRFDQDEPTDLLVPDRSTNNHNGTWNGDGSGATTPVWPVSDAFAPEAPTALLTTEISDTQIDLSWTDNSTMETDFIIERSDGNLSSFVQIGMVGADVTSYLDNTISAGNGYFYQVKAKNGVSSSAFTNTKFGSTIAAPGNALQFDGTDDVIDFTDPIQSSFADFTIDFWVNIPASNTGQVDFFTQIDPAGGGTPQIVLASVFNNTIYFFLRESNGGTTLTAQGSTAINDDSWHHVAYVREGANLRVYLDGQLDGTATGFSGSIDFPGDAESSLSGDAAIDELRFWSQAQSESDLRANLSDPLVGNEAGLVAYYRFDQDETTDLHLPDRSTNNNNGQWTGTGGTNTAPNWITSGGFLLGGLDPLNYVGLAALYNSTDGTNWTDNTNWLSGNASTWFGVTVVGTEATEVDLSTNNLTGTIPTEIGLLTALDRLALFDNQLSGTIPAEVGDLINLTDLELDVNMLSGSIPSEIGNLSILDELELDGNQLSGAIPTTLGNLTVLGLMTLEDNQLTGAIPTEIGNMTNLTDLRLQENLLTGSIPTEIGDLILLDNLELDQNQLSGAIPAEIGNLINLEYLSLYTNELTGAIPPEIGDLTGLQHLDLSHNMFSGNIPVEIGLLTLLDHLELDDNQLSGSIPVEIGSLTLLDDLQLDLNQFTGTVPSAFSSLVNLTNLQLNDNALDGLPDLTSLTGLTALELATNNFEFDDLEPNATISGVSYSPQAPLAAPADLTLDEGDDINETVMIGGTSNQYQWFKDGASIAGQTSNTLSISGVSSTDAGAYHLQVTNTIATGLTISSDPFSVTINGAPMVVTQDISVFLDATGNATITASQVDNGSSDDVSAVGDLILALDISAFDCTNLGANTVTLTVTDEAGNNADGSATVTIVDNTNPVATAQSISVALDAAGNATITPADVDNGSSDNCTATLSLDVTTFDCTDLGANTVTLTVTDGDGNSANTTATVTVSDSTDPVAIAQDISVALDAAGNATITPADVDNGSSDNCTATLSLDVTAFDCTDLGANTVTLTVIDGAGNSANATATVTVTDSTDPVTIAQDISVALDAAGNATITAGDVDNGSSDNCTATLSLDVTTFDCTDLGANTVTLTVSDGAGNSANATATVTVTDSTDPVAIAQDISVTLDAAGNATIMAADVDNGSSDNCGTTLSLDVTAFDCTDLGAITVTLTVSDGDGNSANATATVTVSDSIDPVAIAQDISVALDAAGNATIMAADVDNGSSDNCSTTLSLDVTAFDCTDLGANTVNLTVTDGVGNSASAIATVTIVDNLPPTVLTQDVTIVLSQGIASITTSDIDNGTADNCGFTLSLDQTDFTSAHIGVNTVTLTATDNDGNAADATASVTVESGNLPPDFFFTYFLEENSPVGKLIGTVVATDPEGDPLTYTILSGNTDAAFAIGSSSGDLTVNTTEALDFETTPIFDLVVQTDDGNGGISMVSITINLLDVNEDMVTAIDEISLDVSIYPNPAEGTLFVELNGFNAEEVTIEMFTVSGSQVLNTAMVSAHNGLLEIDLQGLSSGIYVLKIQNPETLITKNVFVK